jgi:hypothetical protein
VDEDPAYANVPADGRRLPAGTVPVYRCSTAAWMRIIVT